MKGPYQLKRGRNDDGSYHHWLIDVRRNDEYRTVDRDTTRSPIAPVWLRHRQAKLNSMFVLDHMFVR
jgi:hypothetical protein